jgi:insulysin
MSPRMIKLLTSICLTTTAVSAASSYVEIEDRANLPLLNSDLAERTTAKIRLSNGLEALLISDPSADQSAAALALGAGSWHDPVEYPGMAHFCEHMLFMGTKRFPKESEFSSLIADNSGQMNAFTAPDRTVYMFSSGHEGFAPLLDRFSRFFIDPLFNPSGISRELHAVDQEFSKNIENDAWREYMVFKETGNPDHPNAKFSTGNSETLGNIPQSALKQWHSTYYSAKKMRLVLYSPLPLEQLKETAIQLFAEVPRKKEQTANDLQEITSNQQRGKLTYIEPIKQHQILTLSWELPRDLSLDPSRSADLFCYALGRGQPYSLHELLRKEGLIDDLSCSIDDMGGASHRFFQIRMELTDKGLSEWKAAAHLCFQAIQGLKNSSVPNYLYQEMNAAAQINYQYHPRKNAFFYARSIAESLLDEDLSTFPRSLLLASSYEPQKLVELGHCLTAENCLFTLMADSAKTNVAPDRQERWMGAKYAVRDIASQQLREWSTASLNPDLRLADPNPFVPASFDIVSANKTDLSNTPIEISADRFGNAYYSRSKEFHSPESVLSLHILSPEIKEDARSDCLTSLYLDYLTDRLHPTLRAAGSTGLHASFGSERNRIHIKIAGFSDKATLLLQEVLKEIATPTALSFDAFEAYQSKHMKAYANAAHDLPCIQAKDLASSLLDSNKNTKKEQLAALQKISYREFLSFARALFQETYTEAFFAGNLTLKDAESAWVDVRHLLGSAPFPKEKHPQSRVLSLSSNGPFAVYETTESMGNATFLILDQGNFTFERRAAQEILSSSLKEFFFTTLRTQQKTGYIVQSADTELEMHLFQYFLVQSNSHEPQELLHRFELFLETALQNLGESIPESRFETLKQNQIYALETRFERNLKEKSGLLDKLAFEHDADFDWIQKRLTGFKALNYETFLKEARTFLSRQNRKRLAVLFEGKKDSAYAYAPIDADQLKQNERYLSRSEISSDEYHLEQAEDLR